MGNSSHDFALRAISGQDTTLRGKTFRVLTAAAEPFYAAAMVTRNLFYSHGLFQSHRLDRPTISVGNITVGGTGKTPIVRWLAGRLRDQGHRPAVLLRGYRSGESGVSDEQELLDRGLNRPGMQHIPVVADPSRRRGAAAVLRQRNDIDLFVLDDAFQHRKASRDFDLVLISATDPFGHGHVLPRGLLREPLSGLRRAGAFLITRASLIEADQLRKIEQELARRNPSAPIFHADHVLAALWSPITSQRLPIETLRGERFFAFCGIGNPAALGRQLESLGGQFTGHEWFADHHLYTQTDIRRVKAKAAEVGATRIITTEKDWVKIASMSDVTRTEPAISVIELGIQFRPGDRARLFDLVTASMARSTARLG